MNFKRKYRDLEQRVLFELRQKVQQSKFESKFIQTNAIKVNLFDYQELVIVNDHLTFLDKSGHHHSVWSECSLEDLIEILDSETATTV